MPPRRQTRESRAGGGRRRFEPACISTALVVSGGLLKQKQKEVVRSLSVSFPDGSTREFVHMVSNADWLCRAVCGEGRSGCPLSRVNLLDRMQVELAAEVARGDGVAAQPADDPIMALHRAEGRGPKKKPRAAAARDRAVQLKMPAVAPELDEDEGAVRTVNVWLRWGRKELWLDARDVPWAIQFMHDQKSMGGVPRIKRTSDDSQPDAAEENLGIPGPAASPKKVEWDWRSSAWKVSVDKNGELLERLVKPRKLDLAEVKTFGLGEAEDLTKAPYDRLRELAEVLCHRWADREALSP